VERREFLEWLVAAAGVASLSRLGVHDLESIGREAHESLAPAPVLDAHASALMTAAAERIIPATATPGATTQRELRRDQPSLLDRRRRAGVRTRR
jgi:hypothetical protein